MTGGLTTRSDPSAMDRSPQPGVDHSATEAAAKISVLSPPAPASANYPRPKGLDEIVNDSAVGI
jgi:hypothetical protein